MLDYFSLLWVDINLNNFIRCTVLKAQNKISKRTYIALFTVGTGGDKGAKPPPPKFSENLKSALFPALCLREKFCSDCIFDSRMLQSTSVSLCGYLSVGQLNNEK